MHESENHPDPEDFDGHDDYALACAAAAIAEQSRPDFDWAIGGTDDAFVETEFAVEPMRGGCAQATTDELAGAIEDLPDFCLGARIITREVTYGPWRYVTPDEIQNG
ncbi:hypothetical protein [Mycobacterium intracellulare]|uniref:Uncharacterized protein n=1 Tax=Mycobacterium intracellulare TaxID=1767 RepID=A0AAE4UEY9_MYCIT|nr:hypothetical protein [Mycobacterium intracellulare]MDV6979629.1 hypothetical protein [Mycobacterium intracellulare]MDV6985132.1 hypothetical protein [Mycobacterium intracellulare]MDV7014248.1 hypothetical protein [Mycobacterium intracellulare]MDV7030123.1 hypothetical protein [Mycobacterium intracellulare]